MNLTHTPAGIGRYSGPRYNVLKDGVTVGHADFDFLRDVYVFTPVEIEQEASTISRCQRQNKSSEELGRALDEREASEKAAILTATERKIVIAYLNSIPTPKQQSEQESVAKTTADNRSVEELRRERDALIFEIGGLRAMRDRLQDELSAR
jgi:hypothetical protein